MDLKTCTKCKVEQPITEFYVDRDNPDGLCSACKTCHKEYARLKTKKKIDKTLESVNNKCQTCSKYIVYENLDKIQICNKKFKPFCLDCYLKDKEMLESGYQKKSQDALSERVFAKYLNICAICDETAWEFLCVDHIYGGGTQHRASLGGTGNFYRMLDKMPADFEKYRLLCQNCNQERSIIKRMQDADNRTVSKDSLYKRNKHREERKIVIGHYGQICLCCEQTDFHKMSIDHVGGGGKKHVESIGGPHRLCEWAIKNNFPDSIRILCHNCNFAQGQFGYCPHRNLPEDKINE